MPKLFKKNNHILNYVTSDNNFNNIGTSVCVYVYVCMSLRIPNCTIWAIT